jgi:hypothetical protein
MYDRIRDLLIGENNAPRRGESIKDFLKRVGPKAHAQMQNPPRESGSKENIAKAIRGGRSATGLK